MRKMQLFFVYAFILSIVLISGNIYAQRNPVLEFCTGTWCGYCPCGHSVIEDDILDNIPNAIIIAYHGSNTDPFKNFDGNQILSSLFSQGGSIYYPTGIPDRVIGPLDSDAWYNAVSTRENISPTVDISIHKTYNETTRALAVTLTVTPLNTLSGKYKVNLILLENGLTASQACYTPCCSSTGTLPGYGHDHVVRSMINGYLGQSLNPSSTWIAGDPIDVDINYSVPGSYNANYCDIVALVYKENTPLNRGEIQQAMQWTLKGDITPVELNSFAAFSDARNVNLVWSTATETNNRGFDIERSENGTDFLSIGFVKGAGTTSEKQNYFFKDEKPSASSQKLFYRLKQTDYDGTFEYSKILSVNFDKPQEYDLSQNYPNPFNPLTVISYSITKPCHVKLVVNDMMGRQIALLVDELKEPGNFDINFDAKQLASGIYFYSLITPEFTSTKKMIVVK